MMSLQQVDLGFSVSLSLLDFLVNTNQLRPHLFEYRVSIKKFTQRKEGRRGGEGGGHGQTCSDNFRMRMRYWVIFVRRCLHLCTRKLGQYLSRSQASRQTLILSLEVLVDLLQRLGIVLRQPDLLPPVSLQLDTRPQGGRTSLRGSERARWS